ncbi:PINIT domain-containing protein [Sordaria brevicollis]|uniref:PINIT domain-containing protein n=1 Tax=Sordaria brevicollis TaxID=83679 RepID=A0AAE0PJJ4_SORBR|nr:PINIT domain-containing protein [Sordaria brevicollis]
MDRAGPPPKHKVEALKAVAKNAGVNKAQLQQICSVNGLPKTGNKPDLVKRLVDAIQQCVARADSITFNRFYSSFETIVPWFDRFVENTGLHQPSNPQPPPIQQTAVYAPVPSSGNASNSYAMASYGVANGSYNAPKSAPTQGSWYNQQRHEFQFKSSVFYDILYRIGEVKECERMSSAMAQHRQTVSIKLRISDHHQLSNVGNDPSLKIMMYCAAAKSGIQDIAFPYQSELKVNGGDVKANLRGLKNKPGSTRPVDITELLRLRPNSYVNSIDFTYALTREVSPYYLVLYLCKTPTIEDLVAKITKKIRAESVVTEISNKANDPDVVATSQVLSLKCPLSYMRLSKPCRGLSCSHIQCFDATSYLQLQEQGPQWLCPICNKSVPFDQLAIDEYAKGILDATPKSVEQVTIEPTGKWIEPGADKVTLPDSAEASFVDDDDLYVSEVLTAANNDFSTPGRSTTGASTTLIGTPMNGSTGGTPSLARSSNNNNNKRSAPEVIDLTLSDDDEPPRPAKRPNYGGGSGMNHTYYGSNS